MKKRVLAIILCLLMTAQATYAKGFFVNVFDLMEKSFGGKIEILKEMISDEKDEDVRSVEEIVTVVSIMASVLEDGTDVYKIEYAKNGAISSNALIADEDCVVSGAKTNINDLKCGDLIIIDKVYDEVVDYIVVVMCLEEVRFDFNSFEDQMFVPNRAAWYKYGEKKDAKHEVYFGYVLDVKPENGKLKLLMNNGDGKTDSSECFTVDEKTELFFYNAFAQSEENKFKKGNIYDIEPSDYPKNDSLDVDFSSDEFYLEDMECAFIYINHGEIMNITLVNYTK